MKMPKDLTEFQKYQISLLKLQIKEAFTAEEFGLIIGKGKDFVEDLDRKNLIKFKIMGSTKKYPKFEMQRFLRTDLKVAKDVR